MSFKKLSSDDDDSNCTLLGTREDACAWVKEYCEDAASDGLFDYITFRYCTTTSAIIPLILWLALLISLLATTADNFFVPQLTVISKRLRLRPEIAGITLLALGNGAPDVFTAISGIDGANDFPLVLSELLGASTLISTVVLGAVLLVSPVGTSVPRKAFLRDLVTYLGATLVIFGIAMDGRIQFFEALLLLVFYISYVSVVVWTSGTTKAQATEMNLQEKPFIVDGGDEGEEKEVDADFFIGVSWVPGDSMLARLQYFAEFPFSLVRWLSIPAADTGWNRGRRLYATASPIGAAAVVLLDGFGPSFGGPSIGGPVVGIAATASLAIWFSTNDKDLPPFHMGLVLLGFISTIAWLDLLANECVALLEAFGLMLDVSTSILGLTVLAMGNSIGDFVADTAVARAGSPRMGIASCFGSPLLNDVVGLGISLTVTTVRSGDLHSPLNGQCRLAYGFLWLSLLSSLVAFTVAGFKAPGRVYAAYLFFLYSAFMVLSCLLEAGLLPSAW